MGKHPPFGVFLPRRLVDADFLKIDGSIVKDLLCSLGVDYAQGYEVSMPQRVDKMRREGICPVPGWDQSRDALRKVPDHFPDMDLLNRYLGYTVCRIPDPFESEKVSLKKLIAVWNPYWIVTRSSTS
jgi:hypothetical protein